MNQLGLKSVPFGGMKECLDQTQVPKPWIAPAYLLPTVLVPEIPLHVIHVFLLGVSGVILSQSSHQDHRDESH